MSIKAPNDTKVLIVDDEQPFREVLALTFSSMDYQVFTAANGQEAFAFLQKNSVDVVISDIRMPGGDGISLLDRARHELTTAPPIILLITGYSELSTEEAYNKGAEALFSKPFSAATLMQTMNRLLTPPELRWSEKSEDVNTDLSVRLQVEGMNEAIESKILNLGRGGVFVHLPAGKFPDVNSTAQFRIDFGSTGAPLEGSGTVRWVRIKDAPGFPPGCGIEFTYLKEKDRERVIKKIEEVKPKAYIPNK